MPQPTQSAIKVAHSSGLLHQIQATDFASTLPAALPPTNPSKPIIVAAVLLPPAPAGTHSALLPPPPSSSLLAIQSTMTRASLRLIRFRIPALWNSGVSTASTSESRNVRWCRHQFWIRDDHFRSCDRRVDALGCSVKNGGQS
jgi:hypothetical protein